MPFEDAASIVGGAALIIGGLVSKRRFYPNVDVPMTAEEKEDKRPPTKGQRFVVIAFGLILFVWGIKPYL